MFFPVHAVEPAVITLKGHEGWVTTVAFSPDGNWIVSGSEDKTLRIWDSHTGKQIRVFEGHSAALSSVAISPNSKKIVSGSWDHTLKIWNAGSGKNVKTLTGHEDQVTSLEFSPDGKRIVSGSGDDTLKVWDATTGQSLADPIALPRHRTQIVCRQHGDTHRDPGVTLGERPDG